MKAKIVRGSVVLTDNAGNILPAGTVFASANPLLAPAFTGVPVAKVSASVRAPLTQTN